MSSSSGKPQSEPARSAEPVQTNRRALLELLKADIKPRDIITPASLRNAITLVMVLGGSTNSVLHFLAIASAADVPLSLDDFQAISDRTPFIADLKPSGRYVMEDLHKVGGTPAVLKYLLQRGLVDGGCMTVTGAASLLDV